MESNHSSNHRSSQFDISSLTEIPPNASVSSQHDFRASDEYSNINFVSMANLHNDQGLACVSPIPVHPEWPNKEHPNDTRDVSIPPQTHLPDDHIKHDRSNDLPSQSQSTKFACQQVTHHKPWKERGSQASAGRNPLISPFSSQAPHDGGLPQPVQLEIPALELVNMSSNRSCQWSASFDSGFQELHTDTQHLQSDTSGPVRRLQVLQHITTCSGAVPSATLDADVQLLGLATDSTDDVIPPGNFDDSTALDLTQVSTSLCSAPLGPHDSSHVQITTESCLQFPAQSGADNSCFSGMFFAEAHHCLHHLTTWSGAVPSDNHVISDSTMDYDNDIYLLFDLRQTATFHQHLSPCHTDIFAPFVACDGTERIPFNHKRHSASFLGLVHRFMLAQHRHSSYYRPFHTGRTQHSFVPVLHLLVGLLALPKIIVAYHLFSYCSMLRGSLKTKSTLRSTRGHISILVLSSLLIMAAEGTHSTMHNVSVHSIIQHRVGLYPMTTV